MLFITSQSKMVVEQLSSGSYAPSLSKSKYAFVSPNYTKAYVWMLEELKKKTEKDYVYPINGCYWGFISNPFVEMMKASVKDGYILLVDVDEEDIVFSDYDKWGDALEGDISSLPDCYLSKADPTKCVQGATWGLDWDRVKAVCPLEKIPYFGSVSVEVLTEYIMSYDRWCISKYGNSSRNIAVKSYTSDLSWVSAYKELAYC